MRALNVLRICGFLEGMSFLVLLLIAMPLKYVFALPRAVRVVGSVHGALFVLFVGALIWVVIDRRWRVSRAALAFCASLVPGGTFVLDRALKRELDALAGAGDR